MVRWCRTCDGFGSIKNPSAPWWSVFSRAKCPDCGGDGVAKPPGFPDRAEMERLRPPAPGASLAAACALCRCSIRKIDMGPNDMLIVQSEQAITPEHRAVIREELERIFPDNHAAIMDRGVALTVIERRAS